MAETMAEAMADDNGGDNGRGNGGGDNGGDNGRGPEERQRGKQQWKTRQAWHGSDASNCKDIAVGSAGRACGAKGIAEDPDVNQNDRDLARALQAPQTLGILSCLQVLIEILN